ncbi:hypothetical protein PRIPAC_72294, partial [Pristionchus pacificus]|uniref:Uncharacterized protein n=1 Tax=Pristionchus pacificus TaxID=54126 RepID=A0A8R1ZBX3_PRIPA
DGSDIEMNDSPSNASFPRNLKWPFNFPSKPGHFPLMDNCTFNDNFSLDIQNNTRYMDHIQDRWNNTRQNAFFTTFAPFLRESCTICNVKLDGPRKQFEHIFTRPHLANMNRENLKYTPSDFSFWNNVLLFNFHTGVKKRGSR